MFSKDLFLIIFILAYFSASTQDTIQKVPLSNRTANYSIDLFLDTNLKQVKANQRINFVNPSSDTIHTMLFHMYYNAFKNNQSSFNQEADRFMKSNTDENQEDGQWSWINIKKVQDAFGNNLIDSLHYISPDDSNHYDQTVLQLRLQEPILPFQSYQVDVEWDSKIPKSGVRTGYNRNYYFMVQWYPKLGVYEPSGTRFATKGQWNCHQYHANTDYYSDFGVYDVRMNVPQDYIVAASGYQIKQELDSNAQRSIYTYLAEDVIDFAWTANPDFIVHSELWQGIQIKLLVMPEHECNKDRFLEAAKHTLSFFESYLEKYPYPSLTIVSPPYYGLFSGAMEYPTLFTAPTLCILPPNIRTTETITMHELTHQYFMQILATNEQEEAWMDEGFTAFFEAKMMDKFYPQGVFNIDYLNFNLGSEEFRRGRFFNAENIKIGPMSKFGWKFKHGGHREIVYGKGALFLKTLEGLVGDICFKKIIQTYYKRWKYKHPCRNDFMAVVQEIVPQFHPIKSKGILDFMHQAIEQTVECDYVVQTVQVQDLEQKLGYFEDLSSARKAQKDSVQIYKSKAVFFRTGEMIVPQDIRLFFDDGTTAMYYWDGKERSHEILYTGHKKMLAAQIDPYYKVSIDKNLINNSYTLDQQSSGIERVFVSFMTWIQASMITASSII